MPVCQSLVGSEEGQCSGELRSIDSAALHGLFAPQHRQGQPRSPDGTTGPSTLWKARWTVSVEEKDGWGLPSAGVDEDSEWDGLSGAAFTASIPVSVLTCPFHARQWERQLRVLRLLPRHPSIVAVYGVSSLQREGQQWVAVVLQRAQHDLTREVPVVDCDTQGGRGRVRDGVGVTEEGEEGMRRRNLRSLCQLTDALTLCHSLNLPHCGLHLSICLRLRSGEEERVALYHFTDGGEANDDGTACKASDVHCVGAMLRELLPAPLIAHLPDPAPAILTALLRDCAEDKKTSHTHHTMKDLLSRLHRCMDVVDVSRLTPAEVLSDGYWLSAQCDDTNVAAVTAVNALLHFCSSADEPSDVSATGATSRERLVLTLPDGLSSPVDALVTRYICDLFIRCGHDNSYHLLLAKALVTVYDSLGSQAVTAFVEKQKRKCDRLVKAGHPSAQRLKERLMRSLTQSDGATAVGEPLEQLPSIVDIASLRRMVDSIGVSSDVLAPNGSPSPADAQVTVRRFVAMFAPVFLLFVRVGRCLTFTPPAIIHRSHRALFGSAHVAWQMPRRRFGRVSSEVEELMTSAPTPTSPASSLFGAFHLLLSDSGRTLYDSAWAILYDRLNQAIAFSAVQLLVAIEGLAEEVEAELTSLSQQPDDEGRQRVLLWQLLRTIHGWASQSRLQRLSTAASSAEWVECFCMGKGGGAISQWRAEGVEFAHRRRWLAMLRVHVAVYALYHARLSQPTRLLVCGPQLSGKTSLIRLLRGQHLRPPFDSSARPIATSTATLGPASYQLTEWPDVSADLLPSLTPFSVPHLRGVLLVCTADNCNSGLLRLLLTLLASTLSSHCRVLLCINQVEQGLVHARLSSSCPPDWACPTPPEALLDGLLSPRVRDVRLLQREVFPAARMEVRVVQIHRSAGLDAHAVRHLRRRSAPLRAAITSVQGIQRWIEQRLPAWNEYDDTAALDDYRGRTDSVDSGDSGDSDDSEQDEEEQHEDEGRR